MAQETKDNRDWGLNLIYPNQDNMSTDENKEEPRSEETKRIDRIMAVTEFKQDLEMTEKDYQENPVFVNPALVKPNSI